MDETIQKDWQKMKEKNAQTKSMFLAIELDEDFKKHLADKLYLFKEKKHIRLEPRRNFHITIGFIANVHHDHRHAVIDCFKPLENHTSFSIQATGDVLLGRFNQILCAKYGPDEELQKLYLEAGILLKEHTDYHFDDTHKSYIPHTKIQTIKASVEKEKKQELEKEFANIDFRTLTYRVKNLALMQRQGRHFKIVHRYGLKG